MQMPIKSIPKQTKDSESMPAIVSFIVEKLSRVSLGVRVQVILPVLVIGIALWGCEQKQVYIPPEYSSPTAAPPSYGAPQFGEPLVRQTPSVSKTPELNSREAAVSGSSPAPVAQKQLEPQPAPAPPEKQRQVKPKKQEAATSPQRQASMKQVSLARGQLERGKADAAIRTLERAVRIDAGNGEAFIFLARAWNQKGEKRKALEFAKKAELLYHKQPAKLKEVYLLESDIYRKLGDGAKNGAKRRPNTSGAPQKTSE